MTVGLKDVIGALHDLAGAKTVPALSAAGIKGVNRYPLGKPSMSWPAVYLELHPEGEGGPKDHQVDSDTIVVDVCVAILATNDAKALQAAAAVDVLRNVYSQNVQGAASVVELRRVKRQRGAGLSVRQFGGEDGPYCHVARVRLTVELLAPTEP